MTKKMLLVAAALVGTLATAAVAGLSAGREYDVGRSTGRESGSRAYLHSYNLPSSGVAIEGYCPVAYHALNRAVRGKPEHASTHDGVTYHFVSAEAKRAFDTEPEKYLPAFGGWCAFGMSVEDKFPVDPKAFRIVDGRLLLFLRNEDVDAFELWERSDQKVLLEKAEAHWKKVRG